MRWFLQATKNGESRVLQETKNISSQELSRGLLLTVFLVADATSSLSHDDAFISTILARVWGLGFAQKIKIIVFRVQFLFSWISVDVPVRVRCPFAVFDLGVGGPLC